MTRAQPQGRRVDAVALLGAALGLVSLALPLLTLHANRVTPVGRPVGLFALGWTAGAAALAWGALALAAWLREGRLRAAAMAAASALAAGVFVHALGDGSRALVAEAPFARLEPAAGAWLGSLALYVTLFAVHRASPRALLVPLAAMAGIAAVSSFDALGVVREFQAAPEAFWRQLERHAVLVGVALLLALAAGVPLGLLAAREPRFEHGILGVAGLLQTVPSVALFGLLLPLLSAYGRAVTVAGAAAGTFGLLVLGWLAWRFRQSSALASGLCALALLVAAVLLLPALAFALFLLFDGGDTTAIGWQATLGELGLHGLGAVPALVALTAYAVLPLVVQTHLGLRSVPTAVVDAARGMGMSATQRLLRVELPLAAPFLVQGLRGSLLLLVGLATVAVLVDAGGLGFFLMRGVEQAVPDLVLLGSLPVLLLALAIEGAMRWLARWATPRGLRT